MLLVALPVAAPLKRPVAPLRGTASHAKARVEFDVRARAAAAREIQRAEDTQHTKLEATSNLRVEP